MASSYIIPTTHRASVSTAEKTVVVESVPVPRPADGQVLVRVHAAAQNPTDWKHLAFGFAPAGRVAGCDFAGVVVQLGPGAEAVNPAVRVGDRVLGLVHGSHLDGEGAFSEHVRIDADLVAHIPDSLSFEDAATLPLAIHTAALGLRALGLPYLPVSAGGSADAVAAAAGKVLLVWSASSSTGQLAVQLAKLAGLRVVATASPRNHAFVRSLGAEAVVDYAAPDVADAIRTAVRALGASRLAYAYDSISEQGSIHAIERCFFDDSAAADAPARGDIVCLLNQAEKPRSPDVRILNVLAYTTFGKAVRVFGMDLPVNPEDRKNAAILDRGLEILLAEGKIRPNPVKIIPGGLAGVQEGFELMKAGKVSGVKLVYQIAA